MIFFTKFVIFISFTAIFDLNYRCSASAAVADLPSPSPYKEIPTDESARRRRKFLGGGIKMSGFLYEICNILYVLSYSLINDQTNTVHDKTYIYPGFSDNFHLKLGK